MESDDSLYSCEEEYFLDLCRGGQLSELQQYLQTQQADKLDWLWTTNTLDNFIHMIAANNHYLLFDYLMPILKNKLTPQTITTIINAQNTNKNTPLHYAVISDAKQMVLRLLDQKVDTSIKNQFNRNPLEEAEDFNKIQIAEILAPNTKIDIEQLKKQTIGLQLNNDSSSDEEQMGMEMNNLKQELQKIQQVEEINEHKINTN